MPRDDPEPLDRLAHHPAARQAVVQGHRARARALAHVGGVVLDVAHALDAAGDHDVGRAGLHHHRRVDRPPAGPSRSGGRADSPGPRSAGPPPAPTSARCTAPRRCRSPGRRSRRRSSRGRSSVRSTSAFRITAPSSPAGHVGQRAQILADGGADGRDDGGASHGGPRRGCRAAAKLVFESTRGNGRRRRGCELRLQAEGGHRGRVGRAGPGTPAAIPSRTWPGRSIGSAIRTARRVCAFLAEKKHMNGGEFMHGGCVMTFADFCLFVIARHVHRRQQQRDGHLQRRVRRHRPRRRPGRVHGARWSRPAAAWSSSAA